MIAYRSFFFVVPSSYEINYTKKLPKMGVFEGVKFFVPAPSYFPLQREYHRLNGA